jgi:hypothetical protein
MSAKATLSIAKLRACISLRFFALFAVNLIKESYDLCFEPGAFSKFN